jgi:putative peptidoglycan lipid II flippase
MAKPAVDLVYRGGSFGRGDAGSMALYFSIFSISLCFWTAQAIYSRAFYAAGNTLTPMIASTIVVAVLLPIYALLFHVAGADGLAVASDIGIFAQTTTLAVLLHRRKMAPLSGLEYPELARSLLAAGVSFLALVALRHLLPSVTRVQELVLLLAATPLWAGLCWVTLHWTGSALPRQLLSRFQA